METITPYRLSFTEADLAQIPPQEQTFCFGLGQLATEISVFQRLLLMLPLGSTVSEIERAVVAAQGLVLVRALIVKLCAAAEFVDRNQPGGEAEWSAFAQQHLRPARQGSRIYFLEAHFSTTSPRTLSPACSPSTSPAPLRPGQSGERVRIDRGLPSFVKARP